MGCHTWCYIKVQPPLSDDEMQKHLLKRKKELLAYYNHELKKDYEERGYSFEDDYYLREVIQYIERVIVNLKATKWSHQILMQEWCGLQIGDGYRYDNKNDTLYKRSHIDIFRKYGYPEIKLTSYEQAIEYYFNPKNKCKTIALVMEGEEVTNKQYLAGENKKADDKVLEAFKDIFQHEGYIEFG